MQRVHLADGYVFVAAVHELFGQDERSKVFVTADVYAAVDPALHVMQAVFVEGRAHLLRRQQRERVRKELAFVSLGE